MDLVSPPGQMPLGWEKDAITRADGALDCHRPDETRPSGLPNQSIQFALFQVGASDSCSFYVQIRTPSLEPTVPLTAIGPSNLPNQSIQFALF
jgi:hypothetical protein